MKQKYDDAMAWNAGNYVKMAIANNFSKGAKYPSKPLLESVSILEDEKAVERKKAEEVKNRIMAHVAMINSRMNKKGG